MKRQTREPQSLSPLEQFVGRLRLLGATDEEIDGVRDTWDVFDADWTAEDQARVTRMNDDDLRAELLATRDEYDHATTTEDEQGVKDAAAFHQRTLSEALEVIGQPIGVVLAWVGEDVGRAIAVLEAEQSESGGSRKGVIEPITKLVSGGEDPEVAGEPSVDDARGGATDDEGSPDEPLAATG